MRLVATGLTFMLAVVLILAIILLVIGNFVIDFVAQIEWVNIEEYVFYIFFIKVFMLY